MPANPDTPLYRDDLVRDILQHPDKYTQYEHFIATAIDGFRAVYRSNIDAQSAIIGADEARRRFQHLRDRVDSFHRLLAATRRLLESRTSAATHEQQAVADSSSAVSPVTTPSPSQSAPVGVLPSPSTVTAGGPSHVWTASGPSVVPVTSSHAATWAVPPGTPSISPPSPPVYRAVVGAGVPAPVSASTGGSAHHNHHAHGHPVVYNGIFHHSHPHHEDSAEDIRTQAQREHELFLRRTPEGSFWRSFMDHLLHKRRPEPYRPGSPAIPRTHAPVTPRVIPHAPAQELHVSPGENSDNGTPRAPAAEHPAQEPPKEHEKSAKANEQGKPDANPDGKGKPAATAHH